MAFTKYLCRGPDSKVLPYHLMESLKEEEHEKQLYGNVNGYNVIHSNVICDHNTARRMFTLWTLVEASLLCLNAVCVLHEERFLAKIGWGAHANVQGFGEPPTAKAQMLNLVRSIRTVAKIPLIFLNIIAIVIKLLLG